jgi:hypothetical protein
LIHQEAYMNANFDPQLRLTNGQLTVAARGPCNWAAGDASAVIYNVWVETQPGTVASSPQSVTVTPANNSWSLDVSSSAQLTPGRAEAYAYVIVTKTDGTHYHPPCKNVVQLRQAP